MYPLHKKWQRDWLARAFLERVAGMIRRVAPDLTATAWLGLGYIPGFTTVKTRPLQHTKSTAHSVIQSQNIASKSRHKLIDRLGFA
jgi:hypothetical protein